MLACLFVEIGLHVALNGTEDYFALSPQCWDYRCLLSCWVYVVLGIKPRTLCRLGKYSTSGTPALAGIGTVDVAQG